MITYQQKNKELDFFNKKKLKEAYRFILSQHKICLLMPSTSKVFGKKSYQERAKKLHNFAPMATLNVLELLFLVVQGCVQISKMRAIFCLLP